MHCNSHNSKMVSRDLTISFGDRNVSYLGHRSVLANASPVFELILFGPLGISDNTLVIYDDCPKVFKLVLKYCYRVEVPLTDMDQALEVYKLADKYLIDHLKDLCAYHIQQLLTHENVNKILNYTLIYNFIHLRNYCFQTMVEWLKNYQCDHTKKVDFLLELQPDIFKELINVYIDNE